MVGIDLVLISRVNVSLLKDKILSNEEKELFDKAPKKQEFLAGRFASKEAFLKANHMGIGEIPLNEIKVIYNNKGAPIISYKDKIYDVSISHDGDYCVAIVII